MIIRKKLSDFHLENLQRALILHEREDVAGVYEAFARIERRGEFTIRGVISLAVGTDNSFKPLRHYLRSGGVKPPRANLVTAG